MCMRAELNYGMVFLLVVYDKYPIITLTCLKKAIMLIYRYAVNDFCNLFEVEFGCFYETHQGRSHQLM